jgi:hypothetical protein
MLVSGTIGNQKPMELISIAAVAENGVIGQDEELPWESIPADKRQYRVRIADSPVILGRVTFDSMRNDHPGTAQIVLGRSESTFDVESAHHASAISIPSHLTRAIGRTSRSGVQSSKRARGLPTTSSTTKSTVGVPPEVATLRCFDTREFQQSSLASVPRRHMELTNTRRTEALVRNAISYGTLPVLYEQLTSADG